MNILNYIGKIFCLSLNKTNSFLEKYPKLEALLYSVRLHGLTNSK